MMSQFIHHRTDIPQWLAAEIGRIAAQWSDLEWQFEETIRLLLTVGIKEGRIVTTGMNLKTRLMTASNLMQGRLLEKAVSVELCDELTDLGERIKRAEEDRNKLVHGLWGLVEGLWYLLWQRQQRAVADFGKRAHGKSMKLKRAVLPQHELISRTKTGAIRSELKACADAMVAFCAKLEAALPPSPHKSPRRVKQTVPLRKKRRAPLRPPLPSGG
jgi:hypothetical protein